MNQEPILIVQLDPPHCGREGDWYYRTFLPGQALAKEPLVHVINLDGVHRDKAEILNKCDVLILNSVVDADLLPILRDRSAEHRLTVYEVSDDISGVQRDNPVYGFFQNQDNLRLFLRLVHGCDAVQYSVPELKKLYGYLNQENRVFFNQLPELPEQKTAATDTLVVGWGGSRGHLQDLAGVAEPLIGWLMTHKGVTLSIMGAQPIWQLFDGLPAAKKRYTPPGSIQDYYRFVKTLDVGLAPLLDHPFNRSRSDIKFVEYAAHGVVPLVQALTPYLATVKDGETGLVCENPEAFVRRLNELYDNRELASKIAENARAYVASQRMLSSHIGERLAFYRERLAAIGHKPRSRAATEAFFGNLCKRTGAEVNGRHLLLNPTRFEQALYQGLLLCQEAQRPEEAAALFREASTLCPENYQPHLCLAASGIAPMSALTEALRKNPRSVVSLLSLGMVYVKQGTPGRALECFSTAAELYPTYELPYLRTAQVLRMMEDPNEALSYEKIATGLVAPLLAPLVPKRTC